MPYYCTVPQCTSMAGKAKNVSFHQFPRDEELAQLWNHILKRGKPYTKYSKVCSLHFRPEDYTITSVGKNKGQWRTLRKDAVPSRNLPSEGLPTTHRRSSGAWLPHPPVTSAMDVRMQQQMAQAIYMQTMLAMQQASSNGSPQHTPDPTIAPSRVTISDLEQILQSRTTNDTSIFDTKECSSYKCTECSKCFKDPDVFVLHKRSHISKIEREQGSMENGKENCKTTGNGVSSPRQETLRANPILANLLRSGIPVSDGAENVLDVNNILSIENQIMAALAVNMESYIRNLSSMIAEAKSKSEGLENGQGSEQDGQSSEHDGQVSEQDGQVSEQDGQGSEQDSDHNDQNNDYNGQNYNIEQKLRGSKSRIILEPSDLDRREQQIIDIKHIKSETEVMTGYDIQNYSKCSLEMEKTKMDCSFDNDIRKKTLGIKTEMISECTEDFTNETTDKNLVTLSDLGIENDSRKKTFDVTDRSDVSFLDSHVRVKNEVVQDFEQTDQHYESTDLSCIKNDNFDKSQGSLDPSVIAKTY